MPLDVKCPQCGSELQAPTSAAGKAVKCPDCGTRFAVPAADSAIQANPARDDPEEREEPRPRRRREPDEGRPRRRQRPDDYDDDAVTTLIPYKNGKALAAYYIGVFSLIPCLGLGLGPVALVFGILGLRYVKENPRAKGTGHAWAGIILGSLTTAGNLGVAILILIGFLASRH
jgi:uncharacterized Zn finger protein (UPF0148 family)